MSARPGQPPRQTPGSQTSHLHTLRTHPLSTLPRPWRFVKAAGAGSAVTFSEKGRVSAGVTGYVKTRLRRIRVGPEPGTGVLIRRGETHTERPRLPRCSHKPLGAGPQELEGAGRTLPWSLGRERGPITPRPHTSDPRMWEKEILWFSAPWFVVLLQRPQDTRPCLSGLPAPTLTAYRAASSTHPARQKPP